MTCTLCYTCDGSDPNNAFALVEQIPEEADTCEPRAAGQMAKLFRVIGNAGRPSASMNALSDQFYAFDAKGVHVDPFDEMRNDIVSERPPPAEPITTPPFKVGPISLVAGEQGMSGLSLLQYKGPSENMILVLNVLPGPWSVWNKDHEDEAVGTWDRILEVNGVRGECAELLQEFQKCKENQQLSLLVKRAMKIAVEFEPNDLAVTRSLGLELASIDEGALVVSGIRDTGLIRDWNARSPNLKVRVSDRVFSVNGTSAKEEMLAQLKDANRLDIEFWRQI